MSSSTVSTYKFKPFKFKVLQKNHDGLRCPMGLAGTRMVCNDAYLFCSNTSSEFSCPPTKYDINGQQVLSDLQIWKYSLESSEWKIIASNVPRDFAFSSVILSGNIIIIYGGSKIHFEHRGSNRIYLGTLANEYKNNGIKFEELKVSGDIPIALNGRGVVMDGQYIYSVGGKPENKHQMDVHRLDLTTRKWELLHKVCEEIQVAIYKYLLEVFFYKGRIYIFNSKLGGALHSEFTKICMFDVVTKQWEYLPTKCDPREPLTGYPKDRGCHSFFQCPEKSNLVYICGGLIGSKCFSDIWRCDLDKLQWVKLSWCTMPQPIYSHSTAVTSSGRVCCYSGMVTNENLDPTITQPSNDIISAWITIPKLNVICWEAMLHYFKKQMFESSDEHLKKIGVPQQFIKRIIETRCPVK